MNRSGNVAEQRGLGVCVWGGGGSIAGPRGEENGGRDMRPRNISMCICAPQSLP